MSDSNEVVIARLQERLTLVQSASERAHVRIDSIQKEIKDDLKLITHDLKILLENMNVQKGSRSTAMWITGLAVALVGALAKIFIH